MYWNLTERRPETQDFPDHFYVVNEIRILKMLQNVQEESQRCIDFVNRWNMLCFTHLTVPEFLLCFSEQLPSDSRFRRPLWREYHLQFESPIHEICKEENYFYVSRIFFAVSTAFDKKNTLLEIYSSLGRRHLAPLWRRFLLPDRRSLRWKWCHAHLIQGSGQLHVGRASTWAV